MYSTNIYSHINRGRIELDSGDKHRIFYAAFELRCAIESRLQEYLNARKELSKKKQQGWRVSKASRILERAFIDGVKVVQVRVTSSLGVDIPLYHTPVTEDMRKASGRLGELLHAQKKIRSDNDEWRERTRDLLERTFILAETLSKGTLLAPPVKSPEGLTHLDIYFSIDGPVADIFGEPCSFELGQKVTLDIEYFDELPVESHKYLNDWRK